MRWERLGRQLLQSRHARSVGPAVLVVVGVLIAASATHSLYWRANSQAGELQGVAYTPSSALPPDRMQHAGAGGCQRFQVCHALISYLPQDA